jgi:hypothetical protein
MIPIAFGVLQSYVVAGKKLRDTTVPSITGTFEDAVRAMLATPPPPKNLGRPAAKPVKRKRAVEPPKARKRAKKRAAPR